MRRVLAVKHHLVGSQRRLVLIAAIVGLLGTFAVMMLTDTATEIGAIGLAPWIGLIGYEVGTAGGIAAAAAALGLWIVAVDTQGGSLSALTLADPDRGVPPLRRRLEHRRAADARERASAPDAGGAPVGADRLHARRHLPHRRRRQRPHLERAAAPAEHRARASVRRHRAGPAARGRPPHDGARPLPDADEGDRGEADGVERRRVRARGQRPRLPRVHRADHRRRRPLQRPDLDPARGDRRPRARPAARRLRRRRLARAAHAAHVDLRLSRDAARRGAEPRRRGPHVPRRDPAQHRPAATAGGGPAARGADRGAPARAGARHRRPRPDREPRRSRPPARRRRRRRSTSGSSSTARRRYARTRAGWRRSSTTSSRTPSSSPRPAGR